MLKLFNCVQIKLLDWKQYLKVFYWVQIELLELESNAWKYLTMCK